MCESTASEPARWTLLLVVVALLVAACSAADTAATTAATTTVAATSTSTQTVAPSTSTSLTTPAPGPPPGPAALVYRLDNELWVDGVNLDIGALGPARWRPGHPTEIAYGIHSKVRDAGVFLFEQIKLRDIESGEERELLNIADHNWSQAGHFDWDAAGARLVFAAKADDGVFRPQILDVASGAVVRIPTKAQIIDTVFVTDGRLLGIDTTNQASQTETLAWIDLDGTITGIAPSSGVNRDPAASPDLRYVANIRASNVLSRVGLGRWDLVITDLEAGTEWIIGDGGDGFGPPRWIDGETLVAKHARYNDAGVVASIPDVVIVNISTGEISRVEGLDRAWDPDPRI